MSEESAIREFLQVIRDDGGKSVVMADGGAMLVTVEQVSWWEIDEIDEIEEPEEPEEPVEPVEPIGATQTVEAERFPTVAIVGKIQGMIDKAVDDAVKSIGYSPLTTPEPPSGD